MYDWKRVKLSVQDDMHAAIELLDREAVRIALVVDDANRLLGTITDGDIRRALLKRLGMDTLVTQIMNATPITAGTDASRGSVFLEMKRKKLDIPLLIGGATTSAKHTAVKIAPAYDGPIVHVLDASRSVNVVEKLINKEASTYFSKVMMCH